ncbi:hypothetical protein BD770DRAFT_431762 [Pilaira anomala]|nr:hypothetical protein BD770DRAFT_431762 [Pilaira anomala]
MSNTHRFFIEDGQGGIITEDGEEAMDYIIEKGDEFNLQNLTNLSEYNECQPVPIELDAENENLENKISLVIEKLGMLGTTHLTKSQLQEPQKLHILELFDNKPYTTTDEVVDSLTKAFEGFMLKKSTLNNFILHECHLTIKRLQRQPKARNDPKCIDARYEWVIE